MPDVSIRLERVVLASSGARNPLDLELGRSGRRGPGVLFLHGLGGNCRSWAPQLNELSAEFRCAAWTMPGYGRSVVPEPFDFETLADIAAKVIERWRPGLDRDPEPVTVVGHSMGGYVAQELAIRRPDLVRSLVLAGTTAAFGRPGSDFNRDFLSARLAQLDRGRTPADLAPAVVDGLLGPDPDPAARAASIESMSTIGAEGYRRALGLLVTWDAGARLSAVTAPTLCLAGEHDSTAPPRALARLAAAIPDARLEVLDGVGHLMNAEDPRAFSDLVARFTRHTRERATAAGDDQP